jgi:hypothetical protein
METHEKFIRIPVIRIDAGFGDFKWPLGILMNETLFCGVPRPRI